MPRRASLTAATSVVDDRDVPKVRAIVVGYAPVPRKSDPDDVLGVDEVAAMLHVGRSVVYKLVARNQIPYRRVGKHIRFSRGAVTAWLSSGRT